MAEGCQRLAKFSLVLNVLICFIGGGCLILLGALILDNAGSAQNLFKSTYLLLPSAIMLISGLFLAALAFVGCFACLKQTKCLNNTFFIIMCAIIVVECAALALTIRYKAEIKEFAEDSMQKGLEKYNSESGVRKEFDSIQQNMHCCGILNYTDWYNTTYFAKKDHFPDSCCKSRNCTKAPEDTVPDDLFPKGCLVDVEEFFSKYFIYLIIGYTLFILIQATALIAMCVIARRSNLESRYTAFNPEI